MAGLRKAAGIQGRIYSQVVGTTGDSCPSIWFFFENNRYIVNCGEGFQRFCNQHQLKLARAQNIFLTDLSWESVGGLPGTLLTLADTSGINGTKIYGPRHTTHFVQACRHFVNRPKFTLSIKDFLGPSVSPHDRHVLDGDQYTKVNSKAETCSFDQSQQSVARESFKDDNLTVFPIVIQTDQEPEFPSEYPSMVSNAPSRSATLLKSPTSPNRVNGTLENVLDRCSAPIEGLKEQEVPKLFGQAPTFFAPKVSSSICCYAFHTPSTRGKFDVKKAKKLGIPPGKAYSALIRGESVCNAKGEIVQPSQVLSPDIPGSVILVVKCPSVDYLFSLTDKDKWKDYTDSGIYSGCISTIYHITPPVVMKNLQYKEWMNLFCNENTNHIAINENSSNRTAFQSAARHHTALSQIDKDLFPSLFANNEIPSLNSEGRINLVQGELKDISWIRPERKFQRFDWHNDEVLLKEKDKDIVITTPISLPPQQELIHWDDTDVTFLGTASAIPGKYRNVSGIHLSIENGKHGILMDAGEGTLGQMFRVFGPQYEETVKALKFIFITHMHADHHLGLNRIIQFRHKLFSKSTEQETPLHIIGPLAIARWLEEYETLIKLSYQFTHIINRAEINNLISSINLRFDAVEVIHCPYSYGFVFKHQSGWKLVYSGDTRPCEALIKAGYGADLLIHEATLEDGMEKEAKKKRHCTVSEAISVGMDMCANSIVLTHFSQRYPTVPVLPSEISTRIAIAFDYMKLKFSWMNRFPIVIPAISTYFQDIEAQRQIQKSQAETLSNENRKINSGRGNSSALKRKAPVSEPTESPNFDSRPVAKKQKSNSNLQ